MDPHTPLPVQSREPHPPRVRPSQHAVRLPSNPSQPVHLPHPPPKEPSRQPRTPRRSRRLRVQSSYKPSPMKVPDSLSLENRFPAPPSEPQPAIAQQVPCSLRHSIHQLQSTVSHPEQNVFVHQSRPPQRSIPDVQESSEQLVASRQSRLASARTRSRVHRQSEQKVDIDIDDS